MIKNDSYNHKDASANIMAPLNLDYNTNNCNIELRPGGIIVGFPLLLTVKL